MRFMDIPRNEGVAIPNIEHHNWLGDEWLWLKPNSKAKEPRIFQMRKYSGPYISNAVSKQTHTTLTRPRLVSARLTKHVHCRPTHPNTQWSQWYVIGIKQAKIKESTQTPKGQAVEGRLTGPLLFLSLFPWTLAHCRRDVKGDIRSKVQEGGCSPRV